MVGLSNSTNTSIDFITDIAGNVSGLPEIMVNVNHDIYGGWLYFVLMIVAWVIMYFAANQVVDQPLNNLMYGGAVLTIISLLLRAVEISKEGVMRGLLSDYQMWVFPVVTILLAMVIWMIKE